MTTKYNRIYAYTTPSAKTVAWVGGRKGVGLLKVGQTSRNAKDRIKEQMQGAAYFGDNSFEILLDIEAIDNYSSYFKDTEVHKWLRYMGVYRLPGTEWFECTIDELLSAIEHIKRGDSRPTRYKDTVLSRGVLYDKGEASRERALIKRPHNIMSVIESNVNCTSNVQIAKQMVSTFNIKQYSYNTVASIIGPVIKDLISVGVLKNIGSTYSPKLVIVNKSRLDNCINNEETIKYSKQTLKKPTLFKQLALSNTGYTLKELANILNQKESKIHRALIDSRIKKVYVRVKGDASNNRHCRYYLTEQEVILPDNEILIKEQSALDRKFNRITKTSNIELSYADIQRIHKALSRIGSRILLSDVVKKCGLSIKKVVSFINQYKVGILCLRKTKEDIYIYRVCCLPKEKVAKTYDIEEKIYNLIKSDKMGVTAKDKRVKDIIGTKSDSTSYYHLDKILKLYKDVCKCKYPNESIQHYTLRCNAPKIFNDKLHKELPLEVYNLSLNCGTTIYELLDIVKNKPGLNSKSLCNELHLKHPKYSESSFNSIVAAYLRVLFNNKLITNAGTAAAPLYHIVDEEHKFRKLDSIRATVESIVTECLSNNTFGETYSGLYDYILKEITVSKGLLYSYLNTMENIVKRKVILTNGKETYRFFISGIKQENVEGEVFCDELF